MDTDIPQFVLIVDDEPSILRVLGRCLVSFGFTVVKVSTVDEAIACLKSIQYDLVITDLQLPGANGRVLIKHVKEHYPKTKVIIIAGWLDKPEFEFFLPKPFEVKELKSLIDKSMKKS